jgi:hypothetical protein
MKQKPDITVLDNLNSDLKELCIVHQHDRDELKIARHEQHNLKIASSKEQSIFTGISTSLKFFLMCALLAGTVLTIIPFTAPIGATILTVTLAIGLAVFIADKIHKAKMREIKKTIFKEDQDISLTTVNTHVALNPKGVKQALGKRNVHAADENIPPGEPSVLVLEHKSEDEKNSQISTALFKSDR